MKAYLSVICSGIAIVLMGCAKDVEELEDPVLAEVGDRRITASQLIAFEQRLPAELKTKKSGLDGYRDYLQTIIDKEIFLQEAIKRGLDEVPEVVQKLRKEKAERVLRLLFEREFLSKVRVDEQELRAAYEAADKEREVKLRLIIVATQAEAEEIRQSLADGEDFTALALSRSLHQSTAPHGGELDGYLTAKRIPIYLQEYINALETGESSEPISLPNGQFGIYQVMHARPELFTAPEEVTLQEIMVQTREEAVEIKERIEAGEDMGALADEYTLRTAGKGAQGTFHIHAVEQSFYRELIDAVRSAEVGPLYGPLAVTVQAAQVAGPEAMLRGGEYYSVFKVLKSNFGSTPEPFDTAAKRARALLKRVEESRLADAFLMGLRREYEDRVVVYEDNIETLLPQ